MIIAIDYDGTYNADMKMFAEIVRLMKASNHDPIIVTMRYEHEKDNFLNNVQSKLCGGIDVFYTGRKAKRKFMAELGIFPAIWIDDNPHWIDTDSR